MAVTHLKSSSGAGGERDRDNARKRELAAAAMVRRVAERLADDPETTAVVDGDPNGGEKDLAKAEAGGFDGCGGPGDR